MNEIERLTKLREWTYKGIVGSGFEESNIAITPYLLLSIDYALCELYVEKYPEESFISTACREYTDSLERSKNFMYNLDKMYTFPRNNKDDFLRDVQKVIKGLLQPNELGMMYKDVKNDFHEVSGDN